jgi:tetratricopeptide (TPR) repeat protein
MAVKPIAAISGYIRHCGRSEAIQKPWGVRAAAGSPRRLCGLAMAGGLAIALVTGGARAEDSDDCMEGAATVAIKGCTSWLAREKDAASRATAFHQRGIVFELVGEYERALLDFNEALEQSPFSASWYADRALVYYLKEDFDQAFADADRAVSMRPDRAALQVRAFVNYRKGDFAAAAQDFARVLDMEPNDADSAIHRYLAKRRLGEEATGTLRADAARLLDKGFYEAAVNLFLGKGDIAALSAQDDAQFGCQTRYYAGSLMLLDNKPLEAEAWFRQAAERCGEANERWWFVAARAELKGLSH